MIDLKKLRAQAQADDTYLYIDDGPRYPLEELIDRCEAAEAALTTARATAMEEAAQWHDARRIEHERGAADACDGEEMRKHFTAAAAHGASADSLRALAPLPPGLRTVPVETLKKLRKCLQPDRNDSSCLCCQSKFHALDAAGLLK